MLSINGKTHIHCTVTKYIEKIYIPFFVKITIHEIACENNNARKYQRFKVFGKNVQYYNNDIFTNLKKK